MKRTSSPVALVVALVLATAGLAVSAAIALEGDSPDTPDPAAATAVGSHWVNTWASVPEATGPGNAVPARFSRGGRAFAHTTVRQTVHVSLGGRELRLRLSNVFGGADLPVTAVSVARPAGGKAGVSAIEPGSARPVAFGGRPGIDIPAGAQAVSDPVRFDVGRGANLTVTLYLAAGQGSTTVTSHPGSRTTSYLLPGDHLDDRELPGAAPVDHWYFLGGVEVWSKDAAATSVVLLGDSLTDGFGSTTNGNNRWPDVLLPRLAAEDGEGAGNVAVVNEAAGGNRVLRDGVGPSALARLDRDVLAQSGVSWLVVFEGVNDIGKSPATPAAARRIADGLIGAYEQIVVRAHAHGIRVYGATLTPFAGSIFDDRAGVHESVRQAVNRWIRAGGRFDAVLDFDRVARDPHDTRRIRPAYDAGDHLHLGPAGYRALAEAVPLRLFQRQGSAAQHCVGRCSTG